MNLNNLIKKIININTSKETYYFISTSFSLFFTIFLLYIGHKFYPYFEVTFLLFSFGFMFFSGFVYFLERTIFNSFLFNIFTKKLKLNQEEINAIKEFTSLHYFYISCLDKHILLDNLIQKNITTIEHSYLEEFLLILKNSYFKKQYLDKICEKITNHKNLIQMVYPKISNFSYIQLSKEEEILGNFINDNQDIKKLILEKLYVNSSLDDFKENEYFLNGFSIEEIFNKLISQCTLKELTHSLFTSNTSENEFFKLHIFEVINLLNKENKILLNKFVTEKVLSEKDPNLIEFCHTTFLNTASDFNLQNSYLLEIYKSKFKNEELVTNDNLKIIHI